MSDYALQGNPENLYAQQVTIANGASVSEVVSTQGHALIGIVMPAAWTGANIGFQAGLLNNLMQPCYDDSGSLQAAKAAAGRFIAVPLTNAAFMPYMAVTSIDSSGVAVNQLADRTLVLLFRRYLS